MSDMHEINSRQFNDLFVYVFNAKSIGAYGRLIYCAVLAKASAQTQLSVTMRSKELADATGLSPNTVKRHIRELSKAKLLVIEDLSHAGFHITLVDLESLLKAHPKPKIEPAEIDIESLDFFVGRKFIKQLLARQDNRCIYTLRELTAETAHLDHVLSSRKGGDNSYRNIVACTFEANARKGDGDAINFLRQIFREGLLTESEFTSQLKLLQRIVAGELKPDM